MRFLPLKVCLRYLISMDKNRYLLQKQLDFLEQRNCWEVRRGMGLSPWLKPALIAAAQRWDFTPSNCLSWDAVLVLLVLFCSWRFSKRIMSVSQECTAAETDILESKTSFLGGSLSVALAYSEMPGSKVKWRPSHFEQVIVFFSF